MCMQKNTVRWFWGYWPMCVGFVWACIVSIGGVEKPNNGILFDARLRLNAKRKDNLCKKEV